MTTQQDRAFMSMAYGLAEKAWGRTSPNPMVGCVVVKRGTAVGWGYHEEAGKPHAEAIALGRAGALAKGATIYITLEPCVHWGRTPPCVDTLLRAGLKRAVISAQDPNPLVDGRGIRRLRKAGLEVEVGLLAEVNGRLNESYIKYITRKIPWVVIKAALTLDGKLASRTGDSRWVSSPLARNYVHLLRGEHDALIIGSGTLVRDDPLLTVRHPAWGNKRTIRVILDGRLRFPVRASILETLDRGDIIVFAGPGAPRKKAEALQKRGVRVIRLPRSPMGSLKEILKTLGKLEITSLLVEGGGRLFTAFIEGKAADKLYLTCSPKLLGGESAPGFLTGRGGRLMSNALAVKDVRCFRLADDLIMEGYF